MLIDDFFSMINKFISNFNDNMLLFFSYLNYIKEYSLKYFALLNNSTSSIINSSSQKEKLI